MENQSENPVGRPSLYCEEYAEQAHKLCLLLGATDKDLASFFDVTETTINNWKINHPEFFESIKNGKYVADMHIANKLYNRAEGAEWVEEVAIKVKTGQHTEDVKVIELQRAAPPDTTACIFWLKNRQPAAWRDKVEVASDHTGKVAISLDLANVTEAAMAYSRAVKGH